jgi:hypothetical protein
LWLEAGGWWLGDRVNGMISEVFTARREEGARDADAEHMDENPVDEQRPGKPDRADC